MLSRLDNYKVFLPGSSDGRYAKQSGSRRAQHFEKGQVISIRLRGRNRSSGRLDSSHIDASNFRHLLSFIDVFLFLSLFLPVYCHHMYISFAFTRHLPLTLYEFL